MLATIRRISISDSPNLLPTSANSSAFSSRSFAFLSSCSCDQLPLLCGLCARECLALLFRHRHVPEFGHDDEEAKHGHHYAVDLGRLRALFGLQIAFLAIQYGIDIEDDLASIVPPEFAGLVDDGAAIRPLRRRL